MNALFSLLTRLRWSLGLIILLVPAFAQPTPGVFTWEAIPSSVYPQQSYTVIVSCTGATTTFLDRDNVMVASGGSSVSYPTTESGGASVTYKARAYSISPTGVQTWYTSGVKTVTVNTKPSPAWTSPTANPVVGTPYTVSVSCTGATSMTLYRANTQVLFANGSSISYPASDSTAGFVEYRVDAAGAFGTSSSTKVVRIEDSAAMPTLNWSISSECPMVGVLYTVTASCASAASVKLYRNSTSVGTSGTTSASYSVSETRSGAVTYTAEVISGGITYRGDKIVSVAVPGTPPDPTPEPEPILDTTAPLVGTLPGEFSVDNKGSANYAVAIPLPPGRAGLAPKLSLAYSSGAGNGPLGIGFSLSTGFPQSITRGRTILARDGVTRGINFDDANTDVTLRDKFYLDGKRLICVSGSYGSADSQYRTEIDSFLTITATGSGTRIDTFVVADKSGTKMTFGKTSGTGASSDGYQPGVLVVGTTETDDTLAAAWALKRVEDTLGNFCTFTYATTGERVLKSFEYTGNGASISTQALVEFSYNTSLVDGAAPRRDASFSYVAGRKFVHDQRLDKITVKQRSTPTSASFDTETVRAELGYDYGYKVEGRTRLKTLKTSLRNPTSGVLEAVPTANFRWSIPSAVAATTITNTQLPTDDCNDQYNRQRIAWGDFDGDGRDEYLDARLSTGLTVYHVTATGGYAAQSWLTYSNLPAALSSYGKLNGSVRVLDLNGDGRKDVLIQNLYCSEMYAVLSVNEGGVDKFVGLGVSGALKLTLDAGTCFLDPSGAKYPSNHLANLEYGAINSRITIADFTGDGRDDVLVHGYNGKRYLYRWLGDRFADPVLMGTGNSCGVIGSEIGLWGLASGVYPFNFTIQAYPCDLNGDGISDYVWVEKTCFQESNSFGSNKLIYAAITKPDGTASDKAEFPSFYCGVGNTLDQMIGCFLPGDFNGDGLTDFLVLGSPQNHPGDVLDWMMMVCKGPDATGKPVFESRINVLSKEFLAGNGEHLYTHFRPATANGWAELAGGIFWAPGSSTGDIARTSAISHIQSSTGSNTQAVDFDHDGLTDLVWYVWKNVGETSTANQGWWWAHSNGHGFDAPKKVVGYPWIAINPAPYGGASESGTLVNASVSYGADLNGDGLLDWTVEYTSNRSRQGLSQYATGIGQFSDLLTSAYDGLCRKTEIVYKAAKDDAVYTPGASVAYPIREMRAAIPVVAEVWKDSGSNVASERANFSYQYSGNRLDLSGRGSLGFHSFVTLDRQTKIFKYQFLAQSFPMTGLTAREQTYRYWETGTGTGADPTKVNFRFINSHDNTVVFDEVANPAGGGWGTVYAFISRAVESRWEDDPNVAHFGPWTKAGSPESKSELLFAQQLPGAAHTTITAESQFDQQTAIQLTNPTSSDTTLQASYVASDAQLVGSGASARWQNVVVGSQSPTAYAKLTFNRLITYGNLKSLTTSYDTENKYTEKVETDYFDPVNGLTSLVKEVRTTVSAPDYTAAADTKAPWKRYTYWKKSGVQTPLVASEIIDTDRDSAATGLLDLTTTYVRGDTDARGRVTETKITGFVDSTAPTTSTTLTVSKVTQFNDRFDLPEIVENSYGHATTTAYNDFLGLQRSVKDVNGVTVETDYDALGRAKQSRATTLSVQTDTTFAWTSSTASDWKKTQSVAVPTGVPGALTLSSVYAVRTTAISTDPGASGASMQPPVTAYFDRLGRTIRTVREGFGGQNSTTDVIYNNLGQTVATSLPYDPQKPATGPVWTRTTYDALGRVKKVVAPNGTETANTYAGLVTKVSVDAPDLGGVDPVAQVNTTLVDAKGRTIKVWNADNVPGALDLATLATKAASIEYKLDGFGRMHSTLVRGNTDATPTTVTASYDALGRQSELNDPDKGSWKYTNNVLGQVVRQEDARQSVTTSTFDPLGRPLTRTTTEVGIGTVDNPKGPVETASWFYYDTPDNVTARPTMHLFPKGTQGWIGAPQREEASTPAAPGYPSSSADAGKTATFHYFDAKGRPSITLTTIDKKWFYTCTDYDAAGRLGSVRNFWKPSGHEAPADQPYVWQDFGYSYTYDSKSYLLEMRDSTGQVWWEADATAGYDHLDRPALVRKGHGHWTKRTYRPEDGALTAIQTGPTPGSATVQNLGFTSDGLGNLTKRTGSGLSETFEYDNLNRLIKRNGGIVASYAINGNFISKVNVTGSTGTYAYTSTHPHAVTAAFDYAMTYDLNGNLVTRTRGTETWSTQWAGFDKPRWLAKTDSGATVGSEFVYNAAHSRVLQMEFDSMGGTPAAPVHYNRKRIYAWGATGEIDYKNLNTTGNAALANWQLDTVRLYVPGPDGVIGAMEFAPNSPPEQVAKSKRSLVYHYDNLGSVDTVTLLGDRNAHVVTDDTGKQARHSFDPWGQRRDPNDWSGLPVNTTIGGHSDVTPRGFTGHEMMDNLGNVINMNGRIYDALLGCFMSADLLVSNPGNAQSFNRYSYCGNNPLSFTDPSGFDALSAFSTSVARDLKKEFAKQDHVAAARAAFGKMSENFAMGGRSAADRIISNMSGGSNKVASDAASGGSSRTNTAPTPAADSAKIDPKTPEVSKDAPPEEGDNAKKGTVTRPSYEYEEASAKEWKQDFIGEHDDALIKERTLIGPFASLTDARSALEKHLTFDRRKYVGFPIAGGFGSFDELEWATAVVPRTADGQRSYYYIKPWTSGHFAYVYAPEHQSEYPAGTSELWHNHNYSLRHDYDNFSAGDIGIGVKTGLPIGLVRPLDHTPLFFDTPNSNRWTRYWSKSYQQELK